MSEKAYQRLGKSIASGTLVKDDGVSDSINTRGHFTLFPYEKVELSSKFKIIAKL